MKKVFIIHGFEGSPNGGWRPWLMAELAKEDIYACALSMPNPEEPLSSEWVEEISRHVERNKGDEIYLVGHSLGVPAILRYLESEKAQPIAGAVLVAGPCMNHGNEKLTSFLEEPFDYPLIKSRAQYFAIIHGDNDSVVPISDAHIITEKLNGELTIIPNGGHLSSSSGIRTLEKGLEALRKMF